MRKLLLGIIVALPLFGFSQFKGLHFGARAAYGMSTYSSAGWDQFGEKGTMTEGAIMLTYGFEDWFAIRSELQFSKTNGSGTGVYQVNGPFTKWERYDDNFSNVGVAIPVLLHFSIPLRRIRPYVDGGLLSQMNLKTTEERTYQNPDLGGSSNIAKRTMTETEPYSFTMMMNLGFEVPYGSRFSYFVEARWNPYLTRIGKSSGKEVSVKGLTLSAGFLF